MLIQTRPSWHISENDTTPESVFFNRRRFMQATAGAVAGGALASYGAEATAAEPRDKTVGLYPFKRNPNYTIKRALTPIDVSSKYNNFYEFGSHKRISSAAQKLPIRPWDVVIDGEVNNPMTLGIEDLIRKMPLEERLYRHRCVEAWSMTVPWSGFPLAALVKLADPNPNANYVRMETFLNPKVARGQRQSWYPWPYVEGLTIEEATNDLAFLATGVYGKPLLKQFGAPLRLAVPWKYGFKSIKSIVRFSFTSSRPKSFWEEIQGGEYGFWANVNPKVPHKRWSQATEEVLGTGKRVATQLFNGYADEVAELYKGRENARIWF